MASKGIRSNGAVGRARQLEEEAAMMEAKLGALKQAMAQERSKRENMKAAGGAFWGASTMGTADVRKGKPVPTARPQAVPKQTEKPSSRPGSNTKSRKTVAAATGDAARERTGASFQATDDATLHSNLHVSRQPIHKPQIARPEIETGMSCGTDDISNGSTVGSVWDGEVDEEKNRREFLEALMAWRSAGKNQSGPEHAAAVMSDNSGNGAAAPAPPPACMDTQTEASPVAAKPAKPRHYFDKLMIEAQARAAGERASSTLASKHRNT